MLATCESAIRWDFGASSATMRKILLGDLVSVADFERLWPRLQQLGLNAYEARTYLVLLGHPRFKAMEAAAHASVPRQKIYEVLDSLVEKGFAEVLQEKTKSFSAVEPSIAIPGYLSRKERDFAEQLRESRAQAFEVIDALEVLCETGITERGNLDYVRLFNETAQTAMHFRAMLEGAKRDYVEFAKAPYAVDPLEEQLVKQARARGLRIRLLIERHHEISDHYRERLREYAEAGVEIREADELPMKLALFDGQRGILALLDPLTTKQSFTSVWFHHKGFGDAMSELFDSRWALAEEHPAATKQD